MRHPLGGGDHEKRRMATAKKAAAKKPAGPAKKAGAKKASPAKATTPKKKAGAATKTPPAKAKKAAAAPSKKAVKKAAAAPSKKAATSPYDARFLAQQKELLLEERETYLRQADALQAEADQLAAEREPGDVQFDEESGEGDTLQVERERDLALSARARQEILEIDHALTKIKARTYGVCEVSGKPIPKERLRAIPQARVRVEYKTGGFGQR